MTEPMKKPARKRRSARFTSPFDAARKLGIPWSLLQRAIENGQVEMRTFGGRNFITDAEIERVKNLLGEGML